MSLKRPGATRHITLGAGTVFAAGALDGPGADGPGAVMAPPAKKTFVLVHGAWHGGWCWTRVAARLLADGHRVFTPTNTGLGERSHLLTRDVDVSTHVTDIVNLFEWEDLSDVVLVGHSYGGMVISGVADQIPEKLRSIVFLDAFMPEDGDDLLSKASPAFREAIQASLKAGDISLRAPPAKAFGVTDPTDEAWVNAKCTPQPFAAYTETVRYTGGREKVAKRTYIRAKNYASPAFDAAFAKVKADPGWTTYEFECGHDVMVIEPAHLTATLLEVA